jgi:hypothetical protein
MMKSRFEPLLLGLVWMAASGGVLKHLGLGRQLPLHFAVSTKP